MTGARCSGTIPDDYGHQMVVTDIERLLLEVQRLSAKIAVLESKVGPESSGADLITNAGPIDAGGVTIPLPLSDVSLSGAYDGSLIYNPSGTNSWAPTREVASTQYAFWEAPSLYLVSGSAQLRLNAGGARMSGGTAVINITPTDLGIGNDASFRALTFKNSAGVNETRYFLCTVAL